MFRITHRPTKQFATAIAVVALGVPATSAARPYDDSPAYKAPASAVQQEAQGPVDLRSPDATNAPQIGAQVAKQGPVDLRSPDATNAPQIGAQVAERGPVDLRSPDARDSAQMAQSPSPPVEIVEAPSFDWGDAGIGAGSVLGLLLITLSGMFAVIHRRSRGVEGSGGPAITT